MFPEKSQNTHFVFTALRGLYKRVSSKCCFVRAVCSVFCSNVVVLFVLFVLLWCVCVFVCVLFVVCVCVCMRVAVLCVCVVCVFVCVCCVCLLRNAVFTVFFGIVNLFENDEFSTNKQIKEYVMDTIEG